MKLNFRFLRSKVAWRIFFLFVCCSLIPIVGMAVFSYHDVSNQIETQGLRRLQKQTQNYGMTIYERLRFLEAVLDQVRSPGDVSTAPAPPATGASAHLIEDLHQFEAVALFTDQGKALVIQGPLHAFPKLAPDQLAALKKGQPVLVIQRETPSSTRLWMAVEVQSPGRGAAYRMGQINLDYLMGIGAANGLPSMTGLIVLEQNGQPIVGSMDLSSAVAVKGMERTHDGFSRHFEFKLHGVRYLASYWPLFIRSRYFGSNWTIILAQSRKSMLAPMAQFKAIFPLVILMSIWVVLLLSIITIRRSLVPLERLQEATKRVASRDFTRPVVVSSRDEFQDLADSFNAMAGEIDRQFKTLTTIAEIDRAILSSLDTRTIVSSLLERIHGLVACDIAVIGVKNGKESELHLYSRDSLGIRSHSTDFQIEHLAALEASSHLIVDSSNAAFNGFFAMSQMPIQALVVVPIRHQKALYGVIAIGCQQQKASFQDEVSGLTQLSDQVAVAVSNARLLSRLDQLNWETLMALARTVDAKSPWTAGHSERVTQLSLKIGKAMGLPEENLNILHRAALLHDIGKISVPTSILDKPGKLTEAEYHIVQQHPKTGARILEPVSAYQDAIPLVLQHHECFDGSGYPGGLAGADISQGARILCVADVYDALISERPYRESWPKERVRQFIHLGAGVKFDPEVVQALMRLSI